MKAAEAAEAAASDGNGGCFQYCTVGKPVDVVASFAPPEDGELLKGIFQMLIPLAVLSRTHLREVTYV